MERIRGLSKHMHQTRFIVEVGREYPPQIRQSSILPEMGKFIATPQGNALLMGL